jgi:hypothetical protein
MTREAITPADLLGRIEALIVVCSKCERRRRYRIQLTDWLARISADCPRRKAGQFSDWCGIHSPDLRRLAQRGEHDDERGQQ